MNYYKLHSNIFAAHIYEHLIINRLKQELSLSSAFYIPFLLSGSTSLKSPYIITILIESFEFLQSEQFLDNSLQKVDIVAFTQNEFTKAISEISSEYHCKIEVGNTDKAYIDELRKTTWTKQVVKSKPNKKVALFNSDSQILNNYTAYKYCFIDSRVKKLTSAPKEELEVASYIANHYAASFVESTFSGYHDNYYDHDESDLYIGHRRCVVMTHAKSSSLNKNVDANILKIKEQLKTNINNFGRLTSYYLERDYGLHESVKEEVLVGILDSIEFRVVLEPAQDETKHLMRHFAISSR